MRPLIDTLEHIHEDTGEQEALGMQGTMKTQLCGDPDDAK